MQSLISMFDKPKIPSHNCTGCGACKNVCRHNCITMIEDEKGFYYPIIDKSICVNCKACIHVCPVINTSPKREIHQTYACKNLDEKVRLSSTSGGLFIAIANYVIDRGDVVIGACFDKDWNVRHEYAETKEDVVKFKGSKYVQSEVSHIYPVLKNFLKEKRLVLFSGTPCQVAGIRSFLHRDYDNLILLDFICHGVPSRKVWKKYLNDECGLSYNKELELNRNDGCSIIGGTIYDRPIIQSINFRNKKTGWQNYSFSLTLSNVSADGGQKTVSHSMIAWNHPYMKGFIGSLYLRPSCYSCPMKGFRSNSDFTLADAWGIGNYIPEWNDDKGISLCIIHNKKAEKILGYLSGIEIRKVNKEIIDRHNEAAYLCPDRNRRTNRFYNLMKKNVSFNEIIDSCFPKPSMLDKIMWSINQRIKTYVKNKK